MGIFAPDKKNQQKAFPLEIDDIVRASLVTVLKTNAHLFYSITVKT